MIQQADLEAALRAVGAYDGLQGHGGTVTLPRGYAVLDGTLVYGPHHGVRLQGHGGGHDGLAGSCIAGPEQGDSILVSGIEGGDLRDFSIRHQSDGAGLVFLGSNQDRAIGQIGGTHVKNVWIGGSGKGIGVEIRGATTNDRIECCDFHGMYLGNLGVCIRTDTDQGVNLTFSHADLKFHQVGVLHRRGDFKIESSNFLGWRTASPRPRAAVVLWSNGHQGEHGAHTNVDCHFELPQGEPAFLSQWRITPPPQRVTIVRPRFQLSQPEHLMIDVATSGSLVIEDPTFTSRVNGAKCIIRVRGPFEMRGTPVLRNGVTLEVQQS